MMQRSSLADKRLLVGLSAIACGLAAVGMWLFLPEPATNPLLAGITRVGVVLGALWLALPVKGESIAWERAVPVVIAAIVLVAVTRRAFVYILPIALVLAIILVFLRPRSRRGNSR